MKRHFALKAFLIVVAAGLASAGIPAQTRRPEPKPRADQEELTAVSPQTAAQRRRIIEGYSAEFYAGNRIESGRIVGSCNTPQGCVALKNACSTLNKHSFKITKTNGIDGVCIDQAQLAGTATWFLRNSNSSDASANGGRAVSGQQPSSRRRSHRPVTFVKELDMSTPSLHCDGSVMCGKVKSICPALGGSYARIGDISGTCQH